MSTITIPTGLCPAIAREPFNLVLYGYPGVGKSPAAAALPDHLFYDLQENLGSKYFSCRRVTPTDADGAPRAYETWQEFADYLDVGRKLTPAARFRIFDPISRIVDFAEVKATEYYKSIPLGANFEGRSILELKGKDSNTGSPGWSRLWEAFKELIRWTYATSTTRTIYIGHPRDAMLKEQGQKGAKLGSEVDEKDLDLSKTLRNIFLSEMDLAGYMYRNLNGVMCISFQSRKQNAFIKCRCPHLLGRTFEFHTPTTVDDWRQIYPDSLGVRTDAAKPVAPAAKPAVAAALPAAKPAVAPAAVPAKPTVAPTPVPTPTPTPMLILPPPVAPISKP